VLTASRLDQTGTASNEGLLRSIAHSAKVAIVVTDDDGKIGFWNPAAQEVFGYEESEAMGRDVRSLLMSTRCQALYAESLKNVQQAGDGSATGHTVELSALRKGGGEFPIELSLSVMRHGEKNTPLRSCVT
jgi:PAS domain S-box-containing protein